MTEGAETENTIFSITLYQFQKKWGGGMGAHL